MGKQILKDIYSLRDNGRDSNYVVFVVYPYDEADPKWAAWEETYGRKLRSLQAWPFEFFNGIKAMIYLGEV
jgi:hypothetical protein